MTTIKDILFEELETYEKNKPDLLKSAFGKYVLIKGKEIINTFDTQNDAIKFGIEKFGNVPFLVKKIEEIETKQNFTSNLIKVNNLCLQLQ
ncbi:MAG TPA: hypothetical protein VJI68_01000 [Candidatus Nanoarchaeia archaeon]|nr:hypothetical protein [Candidatus Nanoarchaeia archaeon]